MFKKVLIANRGAIACRIIRTLRKMGVASVAVYSQADADSPHVRDADEAVLIGPPPVAESYLNIPALLDAARRTGAEAIHPGYGFLSENAAFAETCEQAGLVFIGPTPAQMRAYGLKHTARELAEQVHAPLLPGTGLLPDAPNAVKAAAEIGYPVILKSTAGGGGIGMAVCHDATEVANAFQSIERLSKNNFKDGGIYLEKFIKQARHIEVQIFGDGTGRVLALGERDCSAQRRNQKVIEEAPAPGLDSARRDELALVAVSLATLAKYRSAGTVEFIMDADTGRFYFLEVNTRLQVEHGVTEEVVGVDLVEWMVRLAAGETAFFDAYRPAPRGHAIQVRVYAEDPLKNFSPSCGLLTEVSFADTARVESWIEPGLTISPFYDPMLAKLIVHAEDRPAALAKLRAVLAVSSVQGIETNLEYLATIADSPTFAEARMTTAYLAGHKYESPSVEVLEAGAQTTVQDYPGRTGYWDVGVPPSGPMDHLAHRLANRLLGNAPDAATLEITMTGPTLLFRTATTIALTGADFSATLDDKPLPLWSSHVVPAGAVLQLGAVNGPGARAYLAISGGWQVPRYLGSRATFAQGKFGGHGGRALKPGDILHFPKPNATDAAATVVPATLPAALVPAYVKDWTIGVLYGPQAAPDFLTPESIEVFFNTAWKVHYNSNRTGLRLIGPKPTWTRQDGGEAGLHPSNVHDDPYAIGAINFTGDMPIILGPDGPSLGGFVCPACIVQSELWKIGQLKQGDTVRFVCLTLAEATRREFEQDAFEVRSGDLEAPSTEGTIAADTTTTTADSPTPPLTSYLLPLTSREPAIESHLPATDTTPEVTYRRSGDKNLLIEYGPLVLDLAFRFRVHALIDWLRTRAIPGIIDLTPGVRTLQIHYDSRRLPLSALMEKLHRAETELPPMDAIAVPSRIVHMPLSWDDATVRQAIEKYMQSVRDDAPWNPSNIEFIRRLNGLDSVDAVRRIVFDTSYLVMGLGDVYLGAPAAAPLDPRHRLLTTKYNPARTWTAEGTVGIGGVYMCIYGMESPGGYQLIGRTVPVWNAWKTTPDFAPGHPWLLRFFDQVRFYPVGTEELLDLRAKFLVGKFNLRVEHTTLRLKEYREFLAANADSITAFKTTQQSAFIEERARWQAAGQTEASASEADDAPPPVLVELPPGSREVKTPLPGNIWQVKVAEGQRVAKGEVLIVVESMKMETAVVSPCEGVVHQVLCKAGGIVESGQTLVVVTP